MTTMFKIKFRRRSRIKPTFNPARVWRRLVSAFLLLAASALAGGYFLYRQLAIIEIVSQRRFQNQSVEPLQLDLKALAEIRGRLEAKALRTEVLKLNLPTATDPSL